MSDFPSWLSLKHWKKKMLYECFEWNVYLMFITRINKYNLERLSNCTFVMIFLQYIKEQTFLISALYMTGCLVMLKMARRKYYDLLEFVGGNRLTPSMLKSTVLILQETLFWELCTWLNQRFGSISSVTVYYSLSTIIENYKMHLTF